MSAETTVALLGVGTMGDGMARNIARAGMGLRVWNRNVAKAEPLAELGAVIAATPAEAVAGADLIVTMLFDADSVAEVMGAAAPAAGREAIWVQMTTVGVDGSERLGRLADELGLDYVDAPVLGTKKPAADGSLVVLASGAEALADRVRPLFDAIGSRTEWVGEAGAGSRLKLAANAYVLAVLEGVAESLRLAEGLRLDPALFLRAVEGGAMDSPYVQLKGAGMLAGRFDPAFSVDGARKDAGLILEAARAAGVEMGITRLAKDHLDVVGKGGQGDLDMSALYLAVRPDAD